MVTDLQLQILVDGPSEDESKLVPRHAAPLSAISLSSIVIPKLPRAIGNGPLKGKWKKAKVDEQFESSAWAQSRKQKERRRQLNDFERFKVMRLRKQVRSLADMPIDEQNG